MKFALEVHPLAHNQGDPHGDQGQHNVQVADDRFL